MKKVSLTILIATLLGTVLFTSSASVAQAAGEQRLSILSSLSIRYNEGLIDAYVDNATLRDVLHELAAHTGAHITLSDPATARQQVSAVVKPYRSSRVSSGSWTVFPMLFILSPAVPR
jgi:hypothetical protein